MRRVFLSYARSDHDVPDLVVPSLHRIGLDVWWDRNLRPGVHIDATLAEAIRSSGCVLAVWSAAYLRTGSYALNEYRYATQTIKVPTAVVLLEPVRVENLDITMARSMLPNGSIRQAADGDAVAHLIGHALIDVGIEVAGDRLPKASDRIDISAKFVNPKYAQLVSEPHETTLARLQDAERCLAVEARSPYHALNAALLWAHLGNPDTAAERVQVALNVRPNDPSFNYFAALVASSQAPLVRGPRHRIASIDSLAATAMTLGYPTGEPLLLRAALAYEYFLRNGMAGTGHPDAFVQAAGAKGLDRGETHRLFDMLSPVAPAFCQAAGRAIQP